MMDWISNTGGEAMKKLLKWAGVVIASLFIGVGAAWYGVHKEKSAVRKMIGQTVVKTSVPPTAAIPQQGYRMPSITLTSYPNNQTISTADLVGKPVFINFWASWCPPCKQETPDIVQAYKKYEDKIVFLSINATSEDSTAEMEKFTKDFGMTWPVALDKQGIAMNTYKVIGLPTSFFINRQGIITYIHVGLISRQSLDTHLQEITGPKS
jgi:cytochrome c biogenesis protein CcmG, thiol:disulfide interchange protein DsbE